MSTKAGVLYLDDEENNLFSFRALFRRDYDIYTTSSAQEAVNILREKEIHVIFSDQKMAEISGVEFFELVRNEFPDPVRILVTGYADIEAVIDAINRGQVYRYITKPWSEQELRICIYNAREKFDREQELRLKNVELESTHAELDKFVYSTSHELRAPLVSMLGVMELLRHEDDTTKVKECVGMLDTSLQRLNEAVQNIIYYYQNARTEEILETIDFKELLDELLRYLQRTGYKIVPEVNIEVNGSYAFRGDRHRVRVILLNLLSNGIRYADLAKPSPRITVEVLQNAEKAVVRVSDNGIGIEEGRLERIFEPFDGQNLTSGVGLFISKQAAVKIGANIQVHSIFGDGTRFTIDIPNRA
jgi:signal transduction histidine kinase